VEDGVESLGTVHHHHEHRGDAGEQLRQNLIPAPKQSKHTAALMQGKSKFSVLPGNFPSAHNRLKSPFFSVADPEPLGSETFR